MKAIVCGGRDFDPAEEHGLVLLTMLRILGIDEVVHGAAKGADTWARNIASANGYTTRAFPADWKRHEKAAGPIRNSEMAAFVKRNGGGYCIAFKGGDGTADMLRKAWNYGLSVIDLRQLDPDLIDPEVFVP